ncbi:ribonuclease J [Acidisoma cellulosilytica]|uniref:Ribonuclease J n=1 Tax=Acidisoma cellulosilyticum TaxID=2802395 RepID=A0A963Z2X5_9PROT|nr:ribonuclease J [Acidisoma cellulosilyticum]MCB8881878.1 ribonuclease J [Acidisoma cellulosilyticum]
MTNYDDDLAFLPLGGTGEIGMNLNLYRCNGQWLAVDCGLGFGGPEHPEVDVMVPDASFIAERRDKLLGLVITHAHEDHLGAVAWLWRGLQCPVYATPFAAAVLRRKLTEAGLLSEVPLYVVQSGSTLVLGDFSIEFVAMAHSVPEAQALAITTPYGVILHSGDWKLDPDPVVGPVSDEATLKRLGDQGVLAMVCDSTNALVEGHSGSEAEVRRALPELIRHLSGRVAITCFASNVARLESIALAAKAVGRQVAIAGRSLRNIEAAARECGYLADVPHFLSEDAAADVPDDRLLLILSGSQGEARSAMSRVALDTHPRIALGEGDTVIFSSRVIPGNERAISLVQDNLVRRGVRLMTDNDHMIHVSGHPARDELRRIYALVRPTYSVPVHGEWRHLTAHAGLAGEAGAKPLMLEDGDILELAPGKPQIIDSAPVGRLAVDGNRLVPMTGGVLAARRRMLFNGVVIGSLVVDEQGRIRGNAQISAPGLFDTEDPERTRMEAEFTAAVADLPAPLRRDDFALAESARASLRRAVGKRVQKRPLVDVHLMRIAG